MLASRPPDSRLLPSMALLCGAVVWGLIWYPYRVIEAAGMGGVTAGDSGLHLQIGRAHV